MVMLGGLITLSIVPMLTFSEDPVDPQNRTEAGVPEEKEVEEAKKPVSPWVEHQASSGGKVPVTDPVEVDLGSVPLDSTERVETQSHIQGEFVQHGPRDPEDRAVEPPVEPTPGKGHEGS